MLKKTPKPCLLRLTCIASSLASPKFPVISSMNERGIALSVLQLGAKFRRLTYYRRIQAPLRRCLNICLLSRRSQIMPTLYETGAPPYLLN
jgi:hypothetical protein